MPSYSKKKRIEDFSIYPFDYLDLVKDRERKKSLPYHFYNFTVNSIKYQVSPFLSYFSHSKVYELLSFIVSLL